MLVHPNIDSIIFQIGPVAIRWYGMMYLVGFASAYYLGMKRLEKSSLMTKDQFSDLIFYGALGVILGGRIGYTLFYQFDRVLDDPSWMFKVWLGGMSFHGGLIGVLVVLGIFAWKQKKNVFDLADFAQPILPLGVFAVRMANFINQELWGRASDLPWAMVFPKDSLGIPRHPSQLYEAFSEGLLLFVILWLYSMKPRPRGAVVGLGIMGYGIFRFLVEFAREPDQHLGFVAFDWMTKGQVLSSPMIVGGFAILFWAYFIHKQTPDYSLIEKTKKNKNKKK